MPHPTNEEIRACAAHAITGLVRERGTNVFSWAEIDRGFVCQATRLCFASKAVGIFRPKELTDDAALSIKLVRPSRAGRVSPYNDRELADGLIAYRLERSGRDNRYLIEAWRRQLPLIFFRGLADAQYEVLFPVFVQAVDLMASEAIIAIGDREVMHVAESAERVEEPIERSYSTGARKTRRHQRAFRERVLLAYGLRCALTGLPITELLEAAHIISDADGGEASVRNGIAMSSLHHAAYEQNLIGIDPDATIHIHESVRAARDGPLLDYGLVRLDRQPLRLPAFAAHCPNRDFLSLRFEEFRKRN